MKTIDSVFTHYGIRGEDMKIIEQLCQADNLNFEWLQESILKEYHNLKINNQQIDDKLIEKIIDKAVAKR